MKIIAIGSRATAEKWVALLKPLTFYRKKKKKKKKPLCGA